MAQVKFNYGTNKTELDKKSLAEGSIWFSTEDGKLNIDVKDGNATLKRTTVNAAKADEASKLSTARSITLKGGVSSTTTFDGTKNIELTVPAATNKVAGVTVVYPAAECTTFTSDSGTCTPAAVKKAVTLFGVSNAGDTMSGNLILNNPNATVPSEHPHIEWATTGANTPYIGYATDQTDGTFLVGSLKGTTYATGLAIGGGSGNLLWQGKKVLTIDNSCVATQSMNGSMSVNDKKKVDVTNIAYGTCSTAAATAAKEIATTGNTNWQLVAGSMVTVLFTNTNTASNPTFNVNGTGAKNIFYEGARITTSNKGYAGTTNRPMTFIYDGTQYRFVSWAYDGNTNTYVRTYKDESGTYPVLASRTAASSWDATYESVYGTIASDITMTPSTGTISAKAIERDGLELARAFSSLLPYGVAIAPTEAAPTVLNKVDYLKVGNYYCSSNAVAKYVTDLPLANTAFMMQVLSPLSTGYDNESTSTWVYRLRILRYYTGQEYTQYCYSNGTAGNWTYGSWTKTVVEDVSTGTVTATKFSGSGASLTSLNASNISSGKLSLAYGGTGQNLSAIPAGAIVRNSTDGTGLWYTASAAGAFYCESANAASKFGTLPIAYGGTGATTAANARTNLGVPPTSHASTGTSYGVSTAANYGHAMASSTTPKANGTAAVGSETAKFARGDHVHPLQTTVSGNAGTATKLATARTISLTGDVTGSASFDGSANASITATVANDSHQHSQLYGDSALVYGRNTLQYFNGSLGTTASATANYAPTADWYHIIRMNHSNANGYCVDIAACFHSDNLYLRRLSSGTDNGYKHIWVEGNSVTSAVWNDYAEYRESDCTEYGRVLVENGDDTLSISTERLQPFAGISSDTWGFCQGETEKAKTPIAVAGRVLAYPYRDRNEYKPGDVVCAAPNGTVDIMTREEVINYPDRIIGTVSCVPDYEEWGSGDREPAKVNGRIWIKVR